MSTSSRKKPNQVARADRVVMIALLLHSHEGMDVESSLDELARLIETLGGVVENRMIQKKTRPEPATYIGKGKVEEIKELMIQNDWDVLAVDAEITATQHKNLEKMLGKRVMDRTGIILGIFSKHARTKEAKNQVELASLEYLSSHLTRRWTHLERQKGGIGMRGVGEKQIELDRRLIRSRISRLKSELEHTELDRKMQRMHRDRFLRVAIVGYTNAGKSTLLNALTHSDVVADDRLFATLDSTVRVIDPKTRPAILLSDTVGFIDKLPHGLVASFRTTLAEAIDADLLLHVVDLSSPSYGEQMRITDTVLDEIGCKDKPRVLVFNKVDKVPESYLPKLLERSYVDSVAISALESDGVLKLRQLIYDFFERDMIEMEVTVAYDNALLQSQIYEHSKVIQTEYRDEGAYFRIRVMRSTANWLGLYEKGSEVEKTRLDSGVPYGF